MINELIDKRDQLQCDLDRANAQLREARSVLVFEKLGVKKESIVKDKSGKKYFVEYINLDGIEDGDTFSIKPWLYTSRILKGGRIGKRGYSLTEWELADDQ